MVAKPEVLISTFGEKCREFGLVDANDKFADPKRLAELFVLGVKGFKEKYNV